MWAVIKETGVDDAGLLEFHDRFYPFDTYRDGELAIYKAMGNRKIGFRTWNPIRLYNGYLDLKERAKKIEGNLVGEGLVQGGVLIFDKDGKLRYAYEEEIGNKLELEDIMAAVNAVKEGAAPKVTQTEL